MENNLSVRAFVLSTLFTIFACSICAGGNIGRAKTAELKVKSVKINGYIGRRIDDCISHRVMEQDVDALVEPFRHRNETWRWQSEFWGKWTLGAIETYRYTGDAALYEKIAASVGQIIETQSPDSCRRQRFRVDVVYSPDGRRGRSRRQRQASPDPPLRLCIRGQYLGQIHSL